MTCQYAGFWRRLLAFMIDYIIYFFGILILLGPSFIHGEFFSLHSVVRNAIIFAMTIFLWIRFLGTPGKLLLGCQIVDAVTMKPVSAKQALIRFGGYILSLLAAGMGFFMIGWDKRKQGLHDKLAGTVVVYNVDFGFDDESRKSLQQILSEVK